MVKVFAPDQDTEHAAMTAVQNPSFRMRVKYSARLALLGPMILIFAGLPAAARDPGKEAYIRMFACEGPDAKMEIYLPKDRDGGITIENSVIGFYALDLSAANKGKPLEPVRISLTPDKKTVVVDQFTRGLPPTRIPVAGGTVDFDNRFGTAAKCVPDN